MKKLFSALLLLLPVIASAQSTRPTDFKSLVNLFIKYINLLIPFVILLTFLTVVWGIMKAWIINGGDEKSVDDGKKLALVGVIVLAIMFSLWGILGLLRYSLFGS